MTQLSSNQLTADSKPGSRGGFFRRFSRADSPRSTPKPFDLEAGDRESARLLEWRNSLLAQKEILLKSMGAIEQEFLNLGQAIQQISHPVRELNERCETVVTLANSGSQAEAMQFAFNLLEKSGSLAESSRAKFGQIQDTFHQLNKNLKVITKQQNLLVYDLRSLPSIIVQLKLQSSTLDDTTRETFSALTLEIQSIKETLGDAVNKQLRQIKRTADAEASVSALIGSMVSIANRQQQEITAHLRQCRESLETIHASLKKSGGVMETISSQSWEFTALTCKVVVSLQCQDRVRQMVEHVGAATDEIASQIDQFLHSQQPEASKLEAKLYLRDAAQIQLQQVNHILEDLQKAASTISQGLEGMKKNSQTTAHHTSDLAESLFGKHIISQVSSDIQQVLTMIRGTVEGVKNIQEIVRPLHNEFENHAVEIRSLAIDIRFVSLNAQVYAEQFSNGGALAILSSNLRELSDHITEVTSHIFSNIESFREELSVLHRQLGEFATNAQGERSELEQKARASDQQLQQNYLKLEDILQKIDRLCKEIREKQKEATHYLHFPDLLSSISGGTVEYFEKLVQWASHGTELTPISPEVALKIDQLKHNYTMSGEVEVHQQVMGRADEAKQFEESGVDAAPPSSSELGDNVELF